MPTSRILLFVMLVTSVFMMPDFARENPGPVPHHAGPYLGQQPPGTIPQVFLPGIVSTRESFEYSNTISPDGKEFYFARRTNDQEVQMVVRWENGVLMQPEEASFLQVAGGFEPHLSADGSRLYFTRFAPPPSVLAEDKDLGPRDKEARMVNIWVMERSGPGWGEPKFCVNGMYVTISDSGAIYTTDIRSSSVGACRYIPVDGKYAGRERLPGGVNSPSPGAHPCIARDESFVIFDSKRGEDPENADLYVSFRLENGGWSDARSLGSAVNTRWNDICPSLSPDGKCLFYMSKGDIYWVSAKIIEDLKPKNKWE
jgi:hypothetical protein